MLEAIAVGRAHVVHADGGDCLETRIDLRSTDHKTAAATNADGTDAFPVDLWASAEKVHGGAEVFHVEVGQHRVAWCAGALAPERQVQGQGHETLFSHFGGVEVGALLFDGAHRVADDKGCVL